MKNELLTILCTAVACIALMLGVMGLYRTVSKSSRRFGVSSSHHIHSAEEELELTDSGIKLQ